MNVLFVCKGNVGRSQMAEMIFNLEHGDAHTATSAGLEVFDKEGEMLKERATAANVLEVLAELGIDASNNKRKQLTQEHIQGADTIIDMSGTDGEVQKMVGDKKVVVWEIADPFQQSLDFTREMREQIRTYIKEMDIASK